MVWPPQHTLPARVYTIRRIDAAGGEITVDFALHDRPGPGANGAKPAEFYVLAGDEADLPGITRLLKHLSEDACCVAFIEIDSPVEQLPLIRPPGVELCWQRRA
ncbi:siderophore-interacting protein [Ancylobacter pratisalsi]|uniref:Siderophore-interacting protein n=1 Tax=Ancylobacter pratisalsi TaxID=1745854 RepID=A0A6P1YK89_9HYPH|nr:siderophore-interacting protein [Ancylobacter pratisalsi]QIB33126.1 siderophore-interacting protein [Ancylobacter pratisalsi]